MAIDVTLPIGAPAQALPSTASPEASSSDERWAAWRSRGIAHDRAVRRKLTLAAPVLLVAAAVVLYAILGR